MPEGTSAGEMPFDDIDAVDLADFFKIFGDSTRLRILWALLSGEKCVEEIAAAAETSVSACSHQLKTLRHSDLVKYRRDGKKILYSVSDEHVEMILTVALEHMREAEA